MSDIKTRISALNVTFGTEDDSKEVYVHKDAYQDRVYGFFFCGDVTLFFNSRESVETLQTRLAQVRDRWLAIEQEVGAENA